jgi:tetratricopeptide (TPR) repeat protein
MLLTRSYRVLVLFILLGCYSSTTGCAQEADDVAEAAALLKRGAYEEARSGYRAILDAAGNDSTRHTLAYFETYLAPGDYEAGLQEAERRLQRASNDPYLLSSKARLLVALGRYEEAEATFIEAAQQKRNFWRNALELAELYDRTGQERRALSIYDPIYRQYKNGGFRVPDELGIAARAAARLEEFHDANAAFRTAYQIDPGDVQNLYWWAELFREKYNDEDARRTFADAGGTHGRVPPGAGRDPRTHRKIPR